MKARGVETIISFKKRQKPKEETAQQEIPTIILIRNLILKVLIIGMTVFVVNFFILGIYIIHDNNMYPAIKDGDLCFTYKLTSYLSEDPIVYKRNGQVHFGRIIALPGDTVDLKDNGVYVNNSLISEKVLYPTTHQGSKITFPYTVAKDHVFVLNDFRELISDSRTYGAIPIKDLKGKVVFLMRRRGL